GFKPKQEQKPVPGAVPTAPLPAPDNKLVPKPAPNLQPMPKQPLNPQPLPGFKAKPAPALQAPPQQTLKPAVPEAPPPGDAKRRKPLPGGGDLTAPDKGGAPALQPARPLKIVPQRPSITAPVQQAPLMVKPKPAPPPPAMPRIQAAPAPKPPPPAIKMA